MNILIASLFNLAGPDLFFILLIVLVFFGAKRLPELARGMGQAVKEFNKAKDEFERELSKPVSDLTIQPAQGRQEHKPIEPAVIAEPAPLPAAAPAPAPASNVATTVQSPS
jgi:sec-independent protein translocase protein TatA